MRVRPRWRRFLPGLALLLVTGGVGSRVEAAPRTSAAGDIPVMTNPSESSPPQASLSGPVPVPVPESPLTPQAFLERLLKEHPSLNAAEARIVALREQVVQAGALSDPMLSLGIQNDGFSGIQLGAMENSYVSLMASQTVRWSWERRRAVDEARTALELAQAALDRSRLELRRSVIRLFLQQGRLYSEEALLQEQEGLWGQLEVLASARYQAGRSSLTELLRIRLERSGLQATRLVLKSQQDAVARELRSFLGLGGEAVLPAPASVEGLTAVIAPPIRSFREAREDAQQRSPEVRSLVLRLGLQDTRLAQAEAWRIPAPTLSAGLMVRGALEPMWQLGIGAALPVWARQKQLPEVRARAEERAALLEEQRLLLRTLELRVQERVDTLRQVQEAQKLQLEVRLPLAEALVRAAISEYETGKGGFAPVLDALSSLLQTRQSTQNLTFLALELSSDAEAVSLEPSPGLSLEGGGGRMQLQPGARSAGASAPPETSDDASARTGSSGMGM